MPRYRWTILALGTAAQASYSAVFLGLPVLAPALRSEYDLSLTGVGLLLAAASAGSIFTLLPWGLLADQAGERRVLAAGLAIAAGALAGAAYAPNLGWLAGMLTLAGAAGASVNAASGRAVMSWFPGTAFPSRLQPSWPGALAAAPPLASSRRPSRSLRPRRRRSSPYSSSKDHGRSDSVWRPCFRWPGSG